MRKTPRSEKTRKPGAPAPAQATAPLGSVSAVLSRLGEMGLRASQAKIYRDIQKGVLRRQTNGTFTPQDVAAYAATLRSLPGDRGQVDAVLGDLARQKTLAEIARIEAQIRKQDLDYRLQTGEMCKRSDFERALIMRTLTLKMHLESSFRVHLLDYQALPPEERLEAYKRDLTPLMHDYSRPPSLEDEDVPDVFARLETGGAAAPAGDDGGEDA